MVSAAPSRASVDLEVARVMAGFDRAALRDLLVEMIETPSPSGDEAALARLLAARLGEFGLDARIQHLDTRQANALGRLRSAAGDGPDLLLYSPIDTHLAGDESIDVPRAGEELGDVHRNHARVRGDEVAGLGAENPKGFAACVITAARCIAASGVELRGDVLVGLGAGGMPTNARPVSTRQRVGHGAGVTFMLQQGCRPDYAVIAKPEWGVSWEEVGVTWFRIRVKGAFGYAGIRHLLPYQNPVLAAAGVIQELEAWLPEYARAHASGLVEPQGIVGAVDGGFVHKPTFVPATCDVYLDVRVSPRDDPRDVRRELQARVDEMRAGHPDLDCDVEMVLAIPGSHTPPDNWVVQSLIRAWEAIEGRPHEPPRRASGATDVAILRMWGIPTARLGLPHKAVGQDGQWAGPDDLPMNVVHLDDCAQLVEALVRVTLDTCGRSRREIAGFETATNPEGESPP